MFRTCWHVAVMAILITAGTHLKPAVAQSTPTINFSSDTGSTGELDGTYTATIALTTDSGPLPAEVVVDVTAADGTAQGSGTDYTFAPTQVTFAAGSPDGSEQTVTVTLINDLTPEDDETFTLSLSVNRGAVAAGTVDQQTVTLFNNASSIFTEGQLFWYLQNNSNNVIRRSNLDGSGIQTVVVTEDTVFDIIVDDTAAKLYAATGGQSRIARLNFDGSNFEYLFDVGDIILPPGSIALDRPNNRIYWHGQFSNKIQRANLDGTNIEDVLTIRGQFGGIAVDATAGKVYWTNADNSGETREDYITRVQRANLDGTGIETLTTFPYSFVRDIALDVEGGKMYWVSVDYDGPRDVIRRANLDGSDMEVIFTSDDISGENPLDIVIDTVNDKVYWSSSRIGTIRRADLDGANVEDVVTDIQFVSALTLTNVGPAEVTQQQVNIEFAQAEASGPEENDALQLLTLTTSDGEATTENITIDMAVEGGTITEDYTFTGSFTIAAGTAPGTISIPDFTIVDDAVAENDEVLLLTLSNPAGSTIG
ncbi:MAG: Calx-beta domain-containing protein, partial [Chloroflexota bacterium]